MSTTTEDSSAETVQAANIQPAIPMKLVTQSFVRTVQTPAGGNSCLDDFLAVADRLMANSNSFTLKDFLFRSQSLDLPVPEVIRLFELWTEKLVQFGKLSQVNGPYDDPIFILT